MKGPGYSPVNLQKVNGNAVFELVLGSVAQAFLGNLGVNQLRRDTETGKLIVEVTQKICNQIFNSLDDGEDE